MLLWDNWVLHEVSSTSDFASKCVFKDSIEFKISIWMVFIRHKLTVKLLRNPGSRHSPGWSPGCGPLFPFENDGLVSHWKLPVVGLRRCFALQI